MAIYVISDLHGMAPEELQILLRQADFTEDDWLYILGDAIDRRGDGGVAMLRYLLLQPNIQLILGNHEAMLLACRYLFDEVTEDGIANLSIQKMSLLNQYLQNGGEVTLRTLRALYRTDPDTVADIFEYLQEAPLYEAISVRGHSYILTHGGMENFRPDRALSSYSADELLWGRPAFSQQYFSKATVVLGHTPTFLYGEDFRGKILFRPSWIDIDVGLCEGCAPVLLRLDDLQTFTLSAQS